MKFTTLLSLFSLASSAMAKSLVIPQDLADGAYIISEEADGTQITTDLGNITSTTSTDSIVDKRAVTWPSGTYPWCPGGNVFVDTDFYDHAWGLFYDSCKALGNSKIPNGGRLVVKWGSVVAYMCSYGSNPCRTAEWGEAVSWIAGVCTNAPRLYREAAYLHIPGWQKVSSYHTP
ncbi:hypothetical protein B0T20DRAFT_353832 [Sordaria brevicollis]|uniref:Uncharacterized protein n=1 Tax=Sordaria brevicollis TaxID=83679 RepID=A0AAE0PE05_SORBR|nr:hypothetical protein B0T20DRAFT_353832 [Sordaria brevicollis]